MGKKIEGLSRNDEWPEPNCRGRTSMAQPGKCEQTTEARLEASSRGILT